MGPPAVTRILFASARASAPAPDVERPAHRGNQLLFAAADGKCVCPGCPPEFHDFAPEMDWSEQVEFKLDREDSRILGHELEAWPLAPSSAVARMPA